MFQAPNLHLAMQLLIDKYLFWSTKQLVKLTYFFLYSKITVQTFPLPKLSLFYHAKLISKKWMNGLNEKLFLSLFLFMWLVFTQMTDQIWKEDLARSLLNSTYRVQCYTKLFWNGKAISTRMFGILIFFTLHPFSWLVSFNKVVQFKAFFTFIPNDFVFFLSTV